MDKTKNISEVTSFSDLENTDALLVNRNGVVGKVNVNDVKQEFFGIDILTNLPTAGDVLNAIKARMAEVTDGYLSPFTVAVDSAVIPYLSGDPNYPNPGGQFWQFTPICARGAERASFLVANYASTTVFLIAIFQNTVNIKTI